MIEFFNKLSEEEVVSFQKFLISPYHNSNSQLTKLFRYLNSKYPSLNDGDLSKKKIFRYIYRNKKYNELLYRKLISDYNLIFEKFLIQRRFESDGFANFNYLLSALKENDNLSRFRRHFTSMEKKLSKVYSKEINYYLNRYKLVKSKAEIEISKSVNRHSIQDF